jgi:hypothetical protein
MFLGIRILAMLENEPDGEGLLLAFCEVMLCRACIFYPYCNQSGVSEEILLYISTPSVLRA